MKKLVSVLLMLALVCGGAAVLAECAHPNGVKVSDNSRHKQVNTVFRNIKNDTHDRFFDIEWVYYCGDCQSEYIVTETGCSETNEKHDFFYSSDAPKCNCGRKRPCESHVYDKDGVCTVCGFTCDHADSTKHGTRLNAVYTDLGNTVGHNAKYDYAEEYECNTCKATRVVLIEAGREEEVEEHEWILRPNANLDTCGFCGAKKPCDVHTFNEKGICTVCNYGCDHSNSTKHDDVDWLNRQHTCLDETYHHVVFDAAEKYTCNDCGYEYHKVIAAGSQEDEKHEWFARPDAGLTSCSLCGAKKPCDTHTEGDVVSTTNGTKTYTSSAAGHVASYTRTTVYKCSTCEWNFTKVETITEAQAAHTFSGSTCTVCKYTCSAHSYENGVCATCGHTCDHAGAKHNNTGTSKLKSFVDHRDGTHTRTFEVWHNYECPTCKHVFEKYIEMGTETEPHDYGHDGSKENCVVCNAKKACATHTKSSVAKETDGEKTYPEMGIDYTHHTAVFERTTLYNCDVCGWQFSEKQTVMEPKEKHTYVDGVCTVCANVCGHEYDTDAMFCKHCGMQAPTKVKETTVEKAFETLPEESKEALAKVNLDTPEKITEKLTETVAKQGFVEEQVQVMDVTLQVQVVNETTKEKEWVEVTPENFPTEGLEVTFDPPAGTNVNDFNFVVVHMFTSPGKAGQVEVLTPTVRDGKLVVKFSALSPVSISWKAKPQSAAGLPQTGDDSMILLWAALLGVSCMALVLRKRSRA